MGPRILVVDDHSVMRSGLVALLGAAGMDVVGEAHDGRAAMLAVDRERPDIVIMDLSMPGLNGIEATRQIVARTPGVQVVALSMHTSVEWVHRALDAGATAYVLKGAPGAEVIAAVRAVRAGRRYVSPALGELGSAPSVAGPLASLSARERQVLQLAVEGKTSAQIAETIHLSPKSVETYRSRVMKKLGVRDFAALVKFAVQHGVTPPE